MVKFCEMVSDMAENKITTVYEKCTECERSDLMI